MTNPSPQGGETPLSRLTDLSRPGSVCDQGKQYVALEYALETERALTRATQENEELKQRVRLESALCAAATADFNGMKGRFCEHHATPGAVELRCPECERTRLRALLGEAQGALQRARNEIHSREQGFWMGDLGDYNPPKTPKQYADEEVKDLDDVLTRLNAELGEGRTQ